MADNKEKTGKCPSVKMGICPFCFCSITRLSYCTIALSYDILLAVVDVYAMLCGFAYTNAGDGVPGILVFCFCGGHTVDAGGALYLRDGLGVCPVNIVSTVVECEVVGLVVAPIVEDDARRFRACRL